MDQLAQICEAVASSAARSRKVRLLASYFSTLTDEDLPRAVRFLCGSPFAAADPRRLSIGHSLLRQALLLVSGWDLELVRVCYREVGDTGETISLLLHGKTANQPLTLAAAERLYLQLAACRRTQDKIDILATVFRNHHPLAIRYFVKIITGNLRIGLQEKMVEEAVAAATSRDLTAIRAANNASGDLGKVALAARADTLSSIQAALFHPMDFMLAKPLDQLPDAGDPTQWLIEHKFDGIRAQIHLQDGHLRIFTRGLEDLTSSFPELLDAFRSLHGALVLDGEILAIRDNRPLPFTLFQQRIARKKVTPALRQLAPAHFIAYDILFRDGALLLDRPLEQRRAHLEEVLSTAWPSLHLSPQFTARSLDEIETLFAQARAAGNEGLLLKRRGSLYESGKRSGEWLKLKRPFATLDVVITAAEQGSGRRATVLSDYTFAVRDGDRFLNIGKAYSGLTDLEIRQLTRLLRASSTQRFGRVWLVKPEIVLEVAFDGIQLSSRHKSGFALRFPRILRWRRDKSPADCDTLDRVRRLYESSLQLGANPSHPAPSLLPHS